MSIPYDLKRLLRYANFSRFVAVSRDQAPMWSGRFRAQNRTKGRKGNWVYESYTGMASTEINKQDNPQGKQQETKARQCKWQEKKKGKSLAMLRDPQLHVDDTASAPASEQGAPRGNRWPAGLGVNFA